MSLKAAATVLLLAVLASGCSSMLPRSKHITASPWQSYKDAQQTFDKIIPGYTRAPDLRDDLRFDLASHPNIVILNYSDVLRRFVPNASVSLSDLDVGVKECLNAKTLCQGYEITQSAVNKTREGNFFADILGFYRETHTNGWSFNGLILVKEGVVIYKLTGGQPVIQTHEETRNPLGPIQGLGQKLFGAF
jgi:hypothetical protein